MSSQLSSPTNNTSSQVESSDLSNETRSVFGHHSGSAKTKNKFIYQGVGFKNSRAKLFLGGLALSLLMIAGGIAYNLSQQEGVGEIRQQASTAAIYAFPQSFDAATEPRLPAGWNSASSNSGWNKDDPTVWGNNKGYFSKNSYIKYDNKASLELTGHHVNNTHSRFQVSKKLEGPSKPQINQKYVIQIPVYVTQSTGEGKIEVLMQGHYQEAGNNKIEQPVDANKFPIDTSKVGRWEYYTHEFQFTNSALSSDQSSIYVVLSVWNNRAALFGEVKIVKSSDGSSLFSQSWDSMADSVYPAGWSMSHSNSDWPRSWVQGNGVAAIQSGVSKTGKALAISSHLRPNLLSGSCDEVNNTNKYIFHVSNILGASKQVNETTLFLSFSSSGTNSQADNQIKSFLGEPNWSHGSWFGYFLARKENFNLGEATHLTFPEISNSTKIGRPSDTQKTWGDLAAYLQQHAGSGASPVIPENYTLRVDASLTLNGQDKINSLNTVRIKLRQNSCGTARPQTAELPSNQTQLCVPINLVPGASYPISADFYLPNHTQPGTSSANRNYATLLVQDRVNFSHSLNFINDIDYNKKGQWQTITKNFAVPATAPSGSATNPNYQLCLQALNNQTVIFDNVNVAGLSAPPTNTPVPPTNTPVPPTNTPVPPTNTPAPGCTTNANCIPPKVCNTTNGTCVTPACTTQNMSVACNDNNECTNEACINPGAYNATCANPQRPNGTSCNSGAGTCQAGQCVSTSPGATTLSLAISLDGVPYCEGANCFHPVLHNPDIASGPGRRIPVQVTIQNTVSPTITKQVDFVYDQAQKVYKNPLPIEYNNLVAGPYMIILKGPMHLATRYCNYDDYVMRICRFEDLVAAGNIRRIEDAREVKFIWLGSGAFSYNLSGKPIAVGDLPISGQGNNQQDGKVNVADYSFMLSCIGQNSRRPDCVTRADVDYSGQVNNIDLGLLRKTLKEVMDQF